MTRRLSTIEKSSILGRRKSEGEIGKQMEGLDGLFLCVVHETLKHVFKETGAKVIYDYFGNKCHLKREEIAQRPEAFSVGLERLLSSAGPVIEKMILRNLYTKLELKFVEKEGYEFSDYIEELKKGAASRR